MYHQEKTRMKLVKKTLFAAALCYEAKLLALPGAYAQRPPATFETVAPAIIAPAIAPAIAPGKYPSPTVQPPSPTPRPHETPNSHLTCYTAKIQNATDALIMASFLANQQQEEYSIGRCEFLLKSVEFCIPSTKSVVSGSHLFPDILKDIRAQKIKNDFICYKVKCRAATFNGPNKQNVTDQFGVKELKISKKKQKICVPAWKIRNGYPIILDY